VAAYCMALWERTRERVPLDWASTQNSLGNALLALGKSKKGTARLEEALAAYREALEERTQTQLPLDWAATQNKLCVALSTLGERKEETQRLQEAVTACRAALTEYTPERFPLDWARTQVDLGNALGALGERSKNITSLCEALQSHLAAWEIFSVRGAYDASVAANSAATDSALLKQGFDSVTYQECLARHGDASRHVALP
jgi:tetratricopeptide (TPR) repeat protein